MTGESDVKVGFLYKIISAIYQAIYREIGDDAWEILWKSGEILFDCIKDEVPVSKDMKLEDAISNLSRYIRATHIVRDINYIIDRERRAIEYQISFLIPLRYERREEAGPIYIFSSLFVALMNYLGYTVCKDREPRITEDNTLIERWRFKLKS